MRGISLGASTTDGRHALMYELGWRQLSDPDLQASKAVRAQVCWAGVVGRGLLDGDVGGWVGGWLGEWMDGWVGGREGKENNMCAQ